MFKIEIKNFSAYPGSALTSCIETLCSLLTQTHTIVLCNLKSVHVCRGVVMPLFYFSYWTIVDHQHRHLLLVLSSTFKSTLTFLFILISTHYKWKKTTIKTIKIFPLKRWWTCRQSCDASILYCRYYILGELNWVSIKSRLSDNDRRRLWSERYLL